MLILITYDVQVGTKSGQRRLRNLARVCLDYGVRVQYSVFECDVTHVQWLNLKQKLLQIYDARVDSLRFYKLGKGWRNKVEHHGAKPTIDIFKSDLVI